MRVIQPVGERGSLKWIQRAVAERWDELEAPIATAIPGAGLLTWLSPLASDELAEYRDADFLDKLGLSNLAPALREFWPDRGPQWDALGRTAGGHVLLVEAKAHIAELCSPPSKATPASRTKIEFGLEQAAAHVGARNPDLWIRLFYQLANRVAHLWFLREHGVPAFLILVGFVGDRDMRGPETADAWRAAYLVAFHALGIPARNPLAPFILHVCPRVKSR